MAAPPEVTPDYFQILAVRELRKAGFEVGTVHVHRRSELAEPPGERGFVVELVAPLARGTWRKRALVACRREDGPVAPQVVESLAARLQDAQAGAGIVFSTADFDADAVATARDRSVALLRVADSRTLYDMSGWSTPGHYPPWLPAHAAQVVDRDATGQVRLRLLEAGRVEMILNQLGEEPNPGVQRI